LNREPTTENKVDDQRAYDSSANGYHPTLEVDGLKQKEHEKESGQEESQRDQSISIKQQHDRDNQNLAQSGTEPGRRMLLCGSGFEEGHNEQKER
jgi:hypothetical protein